MRRPSNDIWSRPWALPAMAFLLFAATVASRIPFASRMLYAWDSGNFALALKQYNVLFHQPHPPGYPLYVATAKLIDLWLHDANSSYVAISILASGAAVASLFLLATSMYDHWVGLSSALLLAASVGFWGYGEIAYPYTCLAFLGTLVAWLCYPMWRGHDSAAVLSGLLLGLAGGVREDILLFLGPLWLVSVWRAGIRRFLLSVLVLVLTVASWLVAAAQLSGGWEAFQQANAAQSSYIMSMYSVFSRGLAGARSNATTLLLYIQQMFGLSLLVTIYFMGRFVTFKALVADYRLTFLLLWFLPPTLVYIYIHIGDPGYVLSLLPALCIVTAVGIRDITLDLRSALLLLAGRHRRFAGLASAAWNIGRLFSILLVLGLVCLGTNAFLSAPGPARLSEIRTIDNILAKQVEYARSFSPSSVVVLAKTRYRQMQYYLPEYRVRLLYDEYRSDYQEARYSYQIPEGVTTVLVMDFGRVPASFPAATGGEITLSSSPRVRLWRFDVKPGDTIHYGYDYFGVE